MILLYAVICIWLVLGIQAVCKRRKRVKLFAVDKVRPIILYDGKCGMCEGYVQFCAHRDDGAFTFAALQSDIGRALIHRHNLFRERKGLPDSFVLIEEDGAAHTKSDAALRSLSRLSNVWFLMMLFEPIPASVRDIVYNFGWKHRQNIFGTLDSCRPIPSERAVVLR